MFSKFRNRFIRTTAIALTATLLISASSAVSVQTTAIAAADQKLSASVDTYKIVAVGDSIAAGYEYGFTLESVPYGYAEHVYEQALFQGLRAEYSNYGVLGLKTEGLLKWLEAAAEDASVTAEDVQANLADPRAEEIIKETDALREALSTADLIVASIGGNNFTSVLTKIDSEGITAATSELESVLNSYEADLEAALRIMAELQPKVKIVVADQYLPIPGPTTALNGTIIYKYPEENRQFLLGGQQQLRERLDAVVARLTKDGYNVSVAEAGQAFAGKEMTLTSISKNDIHPTRSGYAALGKIYTQEVWGEYLTLQHRTKDTSISIIVNGIELDTEFKPVVISGRTFLSLRDVTDAMGAALVWDPKTNTASITLDDRTVDITVDATTIRVNGETRKLNAVPAFLNKTYSPAKTYVPLAALSEGLGFQVVYRDTLDAAFIN